MEKNTMTLVEEWFENEKTGEQVPGVTLIIDGTLRRVMDALMKKYPEYKSYTQLVQTVLVKGMDDLIKQ